MMIFRQLFDRESCTYSYILADADTRQALMIDPVREQFSRDEQLLRELGLELMYVLETHIHADHVTSAAQLRSHFGAQVAAAEVAGSSEVDVPLKDGDILACGNLKIKVLSTPGHTNTCLSYLAEDCLFTGDTLLIRGCGRTDFQEGDSARLFSSVREKLFTLPDQTKVYPGHDYTGKTVSTIGEEKQWNPRLKLTHSLSDFQKIMSELKLAPPTRIKEAVPANLKMGK
jgi:sulfur dioxygenase